MIEIQYWLEEHKKQIIILLGSILGIVIGFLVYYCIHYNEIRKEKRNIENIPIELSLKKEDKVEKREEQEKILVTVDLKGAVKNPGVYEVEEGKRIQDVIEMASGLNENADISMINLSKKVTDEMVIIIYTKEEIENLNKKETEKSMQNTCPETPIINDGCINIQQPQEENKENKKISINEANIEELMTLPGIGESKAQAIIKYREENGAFQTIEEIKNVSGIGEAVFAKMESYIIV